MITISVDVDDTCADLMSEWLKRYNRDYFDDLSENKILSWDMTQYVKPICGKNIYQYIEDPKIYDEIKPISFSQWGVGELKKIGRVVFVTSSTLGHAGIKFMWLKKHGFIDKKEDYIECLDKSLISCHYLIDDKYENCKNAYGKGVLYNRTWNCKYDYNPRCNNWKEVVEYIKKEENL
jgi:5'(3')-deoxyribonucleotidase